MFLIIYPSIQLWTREGRKGARTGISHKTSRTGSRLSPGFHS